METKPDYKVVIIGTGFGGTMTGIPLAKKLQKTGEKILMLERGTWWTTPVSTVQDKEVKTFDFLTNHGQPVQFWSSQNHFRGFIDIFTRCFRRTKDVNIFTRLFKRFRNEDGLYDITRLGTRGFLGLFGGKSDGVTIVRASGVGGGSLVYSNITIRPPDLIFEDSRWPLSWTAADRDGYYDLARHAIGYGVLSALQARDANNLPFRGEKLPSSNVNAGLSNIVTRSARLDPHWHIAPDPGNQRGFKQIVINPPAPNPPVPGAPVVPDRTNALWLDRARVYQTAMRELTTEFGTVDSSINDITPEGSPLGIHEFPANYPLEKSVNYCERQGRCNIGCLPGARHTLNKQLMVAVFGKPDGSAGPQFPNLSVQALAEVDVISALPGGGYEVKYIQRDPKDPSSSVSKSVTTDVVIVSAGCLGTNEIILRSKQRGTLPNLSDRVGFGFSTNGDYVAFLEKTKERVSLIRGPVTTSFGHFNTKDAGTSADPATGPDPSTFHTLEDQGVPPALASVLGEGVPLIKSLARGNAGFIVHAILRYLKKRLGQFFRELFTNNLTRGDLFKSEEEIAANMMCVIGMGREASVGQFRLGGGSGETPLRVKRTDGKEFYDDPMYVEMRKSLARLADKLRAPGTTDDFSNPFLSKTADAFSAKSIALSHPLGGCRMAKDASEGVVDEYGRVFDKTRTGSRPFYEGLYIADGSMISTALGVNPSLTIATLSLRIADKIIEELGPQTRSR